MPGKYFEKPVPSVANVAKAPLSVSLAAGMSYTVQLTFQ